MVNREEEYSLLHQNLFWIGKGFGRQRGVGRGKGMKIEGEGTDEG